MLSKLKAVRIGLFAAMLAGTFIGSTSYAAEAVMKVNVIKCGATRSAGGCGSNTPATDSLQGGQVQVSHDGNVTVELKGARANTTYTVFVGNWVTGGNWQPQFSGEGPVCPGGTAVGSVKTNKVGNFEGKITTLSGKTFAFPPKTVIGQPSFAFNNPACTPSQFSTGFEIR